MGCNQSRQSCTLEGVFAAVATPACGQFFDPANLQAEQLVFDMAFRDIINNFGIPVDYFVHTYNLSAADNFYGEHPLAPFQGPFSLMMYIELTEAAPSLSRFGFVSDDDLTGFLHIQTFTETMSSLVNYASFAQSIEPKSGDLIKVWPLGCDRPNGRGAKVFEVTERMEQDIAAINPLLGHYVYRLRAKRFELSFEPNAPIENENNQVFENEFSGSLSSTITGEPSALTTEIFELLLSEGDLLITTESSTVSSVASDPKSYPGDINQTSKDDVFDMSINDTDIYGKYY